MSATSADPRSSERLMAGAFGAVLLMLLHGAGAPLGFAAGAAFLALAASEVRRMTRDDRHTPHTGATGGLPLAAAGRTAPRPWDVQGMGFPVCTWYPGSTGVPLAG